MTTLREQLDHAKERARHFIHNTRFHHEGESYYSSPGWWLVFEHFMGIPIHELPEHDAKYLRAILENDGRE